MNENEKQAELTPEVSPKEDPTISELAKALNEQRANSVSKEQYEALEKKNSELMKAIIDGSSIGNKSESSEEPVDLNKLAKEVFEGGIGNLEYAKRSLKFREEYMKQTGKDPFAPNSSEKMTEEDVKKASEVAELMQQCVDEADGSEAIYNALFAEKIKEDSPAMLGKLRKKGLI